MTTKHWGKSVHIDCGGCDLAKITDGDNIANFAKELVKRIDMKAYGEPQVVYFAEHDPEKAGYTMTQLLETSAAVFHFVDLNCTLYGDVFSCKDFDIEVVKQVIQEYFGAQTYRCVTLDRQA